MSVEFQWGWAIGVSILWYVVLPLVMRLILRGMPDLLPFQLRVLFHLCCKRWASSLFYVSFLFVFMTTGVGRGFFIALASLFASLIWLPILNRRHFGRRIRYESKVVVSVIHCMMFFVIYLGMAAMQFSYAAQSVPLIGICALLVSLYGTIRLWHVHEERIDRRSVEGYVRRVHPNR
ncbi:hypothetical protein N781_04640 [Pontibacillus halophilus JSM 076056 = DSM 19796]|uniref:Uncharacterized protein n=1 Tax=Pontibacillus halophilus JSM 076056 = DSM 19796 TaxID=1385510 RepID=A0A0A5GHA4_9BACI|nr:hypothetical protein [Pontibacillus halophilus]KGX91409.1 hypothetical protein N781_04640 [Pontibacillus halophilus JSM 076056 = DSM 19796]